MKNYFLISEFAKLRGININSLRYYEKMGILKPAFIDNSNGYRYYSLEQIPILNNIILCIQLGIPLKELLDLIDEEGNLQSQKLLEKGKVVAQKRIEEMQNNLDYIEFSLKSIEGNKEFEGREGKYTRYIEERQVLVSDYFENILEAKTMIKEVAKIYKIAQQNNLVPILPAGQIIEINREGNIKYRCFLKLVNGEREHEKILSIPAGIYSCVQVNLQADTNLIKIMKDNWGENEKNTVIIDNMMAEEYSLDARKGEIQVLC